MKVHKKVHVEQLEIGKMVQCSKCGSIFSNHVNLRVHKDKINKDFNSETLFDLYAIRELKQVPNEWVSKKCTYKYICTIAHI